MIKNIFGAIILVVHLTSYVYGCDLRRLELEAEKCNTQIWAGISIPEKEITQSLTFLQNETQAPPKYTQQHNFETFYEEILRKIKKDAFIDFANACKNIYNKTESKKQVAVFMLFDRVSQKALKDLKLLQKVNDFNEKHRNEVPRDYKSKINLFLNADKNINVH